MEYFLLDCQFVDSGAFVPTEWYTIGYHIDDFEKKYSDFTDETKIEPSDSPQHIHFKVKEISSLKGKVKMDELDGVDEIWAPGGFLTRKGGLKSMSLSEMKTLLGKKMIPSNKPISPKIDYAEKHEFDKPQRRNWTVGYGIGGLFLIALGWSFRSWRRSKALLLLFGLVFLTGCGSRPIAMLNASFLPSRMIYDASKPSLDLNLVVNNAGNRSVKIFSVNAGCSCRHVDKSKLPATLRPGEDLKLSVSMNGGSNYSAQRFIFTFETDRGPLSSPVELIALPNHSISPSSIALAGLYEGIEQKDELVELIHREIHDPNAAKEKTDLVFPEEFVVELNSTRKGLVADAPEYSYLDTTYRMKLKDRTLGLHRADIILRRTDGGKKLAEIPVVWQRLPFLSTVPQTVFLLKGSIRVFLRCPDEAIELERVVSSPKGVEAVIISPREMRIRAVEGAPAKIDGHIEVATNANGKKALRLKVVRYASIASRR